MWYIISYRKPLIKIIFPSIIIIKETDVARKHGLKAQTHNVLKLHRHVFHYLALMLKKQACLLTSESMNAFRTAGTSFSLFEHPGCPLLMDGLVLREARKSILHFSLICAKMQTKHQRRGVCSLVGISNYLLNQAFRIAHQALEMFDLMPCSVSVSDRCKKKKIVDL